VRAKNEQVADLLDRVADLLQAQGADAFRVRAYRGAADTARSWERPLTEVLAERGEKGLAELPAIGKSIAASIAEFLTTGGLGLLDRLESETAPDELFTTLPGIGGELSRRIHATLHVETLEELELAAHDGRLARVPGIGRRRERAIRAELAEVLARSGRRRALRTQRRKPCSRPSVEAILSVDEEYRSKAEAGKLRRIAPRRFNPTNARWLPILHTTREGWFLTALFSNSARAHELGKTHDWVVIRYQRDEDAGQCTVVTARGGRAVRGDGYNAPQRGKGHSRRRPAAAGRARRDRAGNRAV
jgi:hypothetical protein